MPERAGGVFIDRTQLQEEKSSWPDDAFLPSSPSPFTLSHGAAVCRRGTGGDCPPSPIVGQVVNCRRSLGLLVFAGCELCFVLCILRVLLDMNVL